MISVRYRAGKTRRVVGGFPEYWGTSEALRVGVRPDRGTGKDRKWVFTWTGEPGKTGSGYSPGPGNIIVYCEKPIYYM